MSIFVTYERTLESTSMRFEVGDRRLQMIRLRNTYAHTDAVFKLQSTCSRTFKVRPTLERVQANQSIDIQLQLSSQAQEPSECKFLVIVRAIPSHVVEDYELKRLWKKCELQIDSLLYSETIHVMVIQPLPSVEDRAKMVLLMMKNQSKRSKNQLLPSEICILQHLRTYQPEEWKRLDTYAKTLRVQLKEYRKGQIQLT